MIYNLRQTEKFGDNNLAASFFDSHSSYHKKNAILPKKIFKSIEIKL